MGGVTEGIRRPRLHVFVCTHTRDPSSPLGAGCRDRGEPLASRLRQLVARQRAIASVWITETHCMGLCPQAGVTVALYPGKGVLVTSSEAEDVEASVRDACSAHMGTIRDRAEESDAPTSGRSSTPS